MPKNPTKAFAQFKSEGDSIDDYLDQAEFEEIFQAIEKAQQEFASGARRRKEQLESLTEVKLEDGIVR